jgi:uncharacterized membrane protein YeaQ/YmgE (transglycosylase-associated protein family)
VTARRLRVPRPSFDNMGLFAFILAGLVVGFVARVIVPGKRGMGRVATALFILAGGFLGGLVGGLFYGRRVFDLHGSTIIGGIMSVFTLLFLLGVRARGRRGPTF